MTAAVSVRWLSTSLALALAALVAPALAGATVRHCPAAEMVVARGTSEPGALGVIVGDPLYRALRTIRPGLASYGVRYPATGAKTSPELGDRDLVSHLRKQAARCPHQRFVLVGYSQGANVIEMALGEDTTKAVVGGPSVARIPRRLTPRIAAILLFGNPLRKIGGSVPSSFRIRTLDTCNPGDLICDPAGTQFVKHLLYGPYVQRAATFAAKRLARRR